MFTLPSFIFEQKPHSNTQKKATKHCHLFYFKFLSDRIQTYLNDLNIGSING